MLVYSKRECLWCSMIVFPMDLSSASNSGRLYEVILSRRKSDPKRTQTDCSYTGTGRYLQLHRNVSEDTKDALAKISGIPF